MVLLLRGLFGSMLIGMLVLTLIASWEQGLVPAARALWPDAWFRATLADAYIGFVTMYVWIAYKEPRVSARIVWFVLLMTLGTIAISGYVLYQLYRLKPTDSLERVLLRT